MELEIKQMQFEAEEESKRIILNAEQKAAETIQELRKESKEREDKIKTTEDRLIKKEDLLDRRQSDIDSEVENLKNKALEIREIKDRADKILEERKLGLERISRLSETEARDELMKEAEIKYAEDLVVRMQKLETGNEEKLESKARDIMTTAIQRLGNSVASDIFSTTVHIPSDEIKGKIIGKEGRNIKAFERITGVEVIVDDTPGTIIISSFDPVRRQVARMALEELVQDGRIQPAKIEKVVEKAQENVGK